MRAVQDEGQAGGTQCAPCTTPHTTTHPDSPPPHLLVLLPTLLLVPLAAVPAAVVIRPAAAAAAALHGNSTLRTRRRLIGLPAAAVALATLLAAATSCCLGGSARVLHLSRCIAAAGAPIAGAILGGGGTAAGPLPLPLCRWPLLAVGGLLRLLALALGAGTCGRRRAGVDSGSQSMHREEQPTHSYRHRARLCRRQHSGRRTCIAACFLPLLWLLPPAALGPPLAARGAVALVPTLPPSLACGRLAIVTAALAAGRALAPAAGCRLLLAPRWPLPASVLPLALAACSWPLSCSLTLTRAAGRRCCCWLITARPLGVTLAGSRLVSGAGAAAAKAPALARHIRCCFRAQRGGTDKPNPAALLLLAPRLFATAAGAGRALIAPLPRRPVALAAAVPLPCCRRISP